MCWWCLDIYSCSWQALLNSKAPKTFYLCFNGVWVNSKCSGMFMTLYVNLLVQNLCYFHFTKIHVQLICAIGMAHVNLPHSTLFWIFISQDQNTRMKFLLWLLYGWVYKFISFCNFLKSKIICWRKRQTNSRRQPKCIY